MEEKEKIKKECIKGFEYIEGISKHYMTNVWSKENPQKAQELKAKWIEMVKVSNEVIALKGEDTCERMFAAIVKEIRKKTIKPKEGWVKLAEEICPEGQMREGVEEWWDHYYSINKDTIVLEPYGVTMDSMTDLIKVCNRLNLDFEICPELATHFPTRTLPIVIKRR